MRWIALVLLFACGGEPRPETQDSGPIARGVNGTGPTDAGGLWDLAAPCMVNTDCPVFVDADAGTDAGVAFCGTSGAQPWCVLAPFDVGCPDGSASGATVIEPSCLKLCPAGPADCSALTNCYQGFCIPR